MKPPPSARFAPTPSGPLHLGGFLTALVSWLDAKAQGHRWVLRFEDVDTLRTAEGAAAHIRETLARHGLLWDDEAPLQSQRHDAYQKALGQLHHLGSLYGCQCSRKVRDSHPRNAAGERLYPGTCRHLGLPLESAPSLRFSTENACPTGSSTPIWKIHDRMQPTLVQDLPKQMGDFVVRRVEGFVSYQLAVVVDDAEQGITSVVRGLDIYPLTAQQAALQKALGYAHPRWLHLPLLVGKDGQKLSKQNHAEAVKNDAPVELLQKSLRLLFPSWTCPLNLTLGETLERAVLFWSSHLDHPSTAFRHTTHIHIHEMEAL